MSKSLLDAVRNLQSPLVVSISTDQTEIEVDQAFTSSPTTSLSASFDSVHKYMESIYPQPKYILIPTVSALNILISFIPDDAPIRQKMLYASSKNALITELGLGLLESFAWTELEELTHEFYKKSTALDSHNALTEEEKINAAISSLEATSLTQNYYKRELASMHASSSSDGLLYAFEADLSAAIDQLSESTLVAFGINDAQKKILLNLVKNSVTVNSLVSDLESATSQLPVYAIYSHKSGPVFIYACPLGSKVKDRMLYASFKLDLLNHLKKSGLEFTKSFEVGDVDELELSELESSSGVSTPVSDTSGRSTPDSRLRFSKPKGPRRR